MDVSLKGGVHTLGQTPLFYAASTGFPQVAGYLLDRGASLQAVDRCQQTVLFWAAKQCNYLTLELLLSRRVDPTQTDQDCQSALFYAAKAPMRTRPVHIETQCHCLRLLLQARCPADSTDVLGQTPLFYAAQTDPKKADCLLQHRATVNLRDRDGQTALLFATSANEDQAAETCRLLLERRADPDLASNTGVTPISLLKSRPELVAAFIGPCKAPTLRPRGADAASGAVSRRRPGAGAQEATRTRAPGRPAPTAAPQSRSASMALLKRCPSSPLEARAPELCAVCSEPMLPQERCGRLPCLHLFHEECIDRWFREKPMCPLDNMKLEDMVAADSQVSTGGGGRSGEPRARSRSGRWRRARSRGATGLVTQLESIG